MRPSPTSPVPLSLRKLLQVVVMAGVAAVVAVAAGATDLEVRRVRYFSAPEYTRIVLDLNQPGPFEVRELRDPDRLVINVAGARLANTGTIAVGDGLVKQIRRTQNGARGQIVLDLEFLARQENFSLAAAAGRPARIVVDVFRDRGGSVPQEQAAPPIAAVEVVLPEAQPRGGVLVTDGGVPDLTAADRAAMALAPARPESLIAPRPRPLRVILDPGHGGMDPGAIRGKVREKDVVLAVCLELKKLLDAEPGIETVLTRARDYYPSLSRRVDIAREQRGDLFLSIHCNTHPRASVSGMEVYFLSLQGATDREAQELADKENAADLVGLAPGTTQGDAVLSILMDLRMTQVLQQSSRLAESVLQATAAAGLEATRAKQARFQVLRTLAMPAVLVELAYLSNPGDCALLASKEGRHQYASVLAAGVLRFRADRELSGVIAGAGPERSVDRDWDRRYKVRRGDSLWNLAQRHGVTMEEIALQNHLRDRSLRIGQSLRLPGE
jgi:N-acetylmuramoyl-L-alanine amidase